MPRPQHIYHAIQNIVAIQVTLYNIQFKSTSQSLSTAYPSLQDIIPHAVYHSLALLRMGTELPKTCWADLKTNKLLLLQLVGHLLYLYNITNITNKAKQTFYK